MLLADRQNIIYVYCTQTFQRLNQFVLIHHQQNDHAIHMTSLSETSTVFVLLSDNSIYSVDLNALLHRTQNSVPSSNIYRYIANVSLPTYKIVALPTASDRK